MNYIMYQEYYFANVQEDDGEPEGFGSLVNAETGGS